MGEAYFHQVDTRRLIYGISQWPDLTLYVGAGAAVDRTGLTWQKLIDELLRFIVPDQSVREALVRQYDPVRAASVACDLFEASHGNAWQAVMHDRLRSLLYSPRELMVGRMLDASCRLAVQFTRNSKSVCIVTTNFDVFLLETLRRRLDLERTPPESLKVLYADEHNAVDVQRALRTPGITCVFLHGLVPRSGTFAHPAVISERDYNRISPRTHSLLRAAFKNRNVLIVGSSFTDPPLLSALHNTMPNEVAPASARRGAGSSSTSIAGGRPSRLAVLPLQGSEWAGASSVELPRLQDLTRRRAHHFSVATTFPDFFFQVGQFLDEVRTSAIHSTERNRYSDYVCNFRYGSRLESWWRNWLEVTRVSPKMQRSHHLELARKLHAIRDVMRVSANESTKLEVWIRWHPENHRHLCLWASSVGTWPDVLSMRKDSITEDSDYRSVRVFCYGSPSFLEAEDSADTRWKTYLGIPIWKQDALGFLPVGVVTLASTMNSEHSSVTAQNLERLRPVIPLMKEAGHNTLLRPESLPEADGTD